MLYDRIQEAIKYIHSKVNLSPKFGIILGTGLGGLTKEIEIEKAINYSDIPHFPQSTVEGHQGELIFGYINKIPIVAMSGRFHFYEGYSMEEVTFGIRVLKFLNIKKLFISNISGSVNPKMNAGDIVILKDHINFQGDNPLIGSNDERLGPRFPDMLNIYDKELIQMGLDIANANNIPIHTGVYLALQGPSLETPAEYKMIHVLGADLVGMSTVPEVIVAKHMSLPVFVLSIVSNKSFPIEEIKETTIEEAIAVANAAEPKMSLIVKEMISKLNN